MYISTLVKPLPLTELAELQKNRFTVINFYQTITTIMSKYIPLFPSLPAPLPGSQVIWFNFKIKVGMWGHDSPIAHPLWSQRNLNKGTHRRIWRYPLRSAPPSKNSGSTLRTIRSNAEYHVIWYDSLFTNTQNRESHYYPKKIEYMCTHPSEITRLPEIREMSKICGRLFWHNFFYLKPCLRTFL